MASYKLPVIEINEKELKPGSERWSKVCDEVIGALEEYGCFVAVYDKITQEIQNEVLQSLQELFDCPLDTKLQNKSSKPMHGYAGQVPVIPVYESMAFDYSNTIEGIHNFTKVMWPRGNNQFTEKLFAYTKIAAELQNIVTQMVFEGYGVGKYSESYINSTNYLCRVNKYRQPRPDENTVGLLPHTDKSFMSTVHQIQVDGFEIKTNDGEWFGFHDLSPSSIVFLAGDAIMAWSNDRIKSCIHRVNMEGRGERYSITLFSFMENIIVQIPDELIDDDHPLKYKPFDHYEFLNFYKKEGNLKLERAIGNYCGI